MGRSKDFACDTPGWTIEVFFSAFFFCHFCPERGPGIGSVETWLHSRGVSRIVLLKPKLVTVDRVFLMKEVHMGYYLRPYSLTVDVVSARRQSKML
jgi:hypothetical protein